MRHTSITSITDSNYRRLNLSPNICVISMLGILLLRNQYKQQKPIAKLKYDEIYQIIVCEVLFVSPAEGSLKKRLSD